MLQLLANLDWKGFFGTFLGAGLAFVSTKIHDSSRRHRECVASGNLALFALQSQFNEFLLFRKGFYEEVGNQQLAPDHPQWLLTRPSFQTYVGHKIDFDSLGFLLVEPGQGELLNKLHLAQVSYQDLIRLDEFRNKVMIEIQEKTVEFEKSHVGNLTPSSHEHYIGRYLIEASKMAVVALALRARDNEEIYIDAFDSLRAVLEVKLNQNWYRQLGRILSCKNPKKTLFLRMKTDPKFAKDTLPNFHQGLADALKILDEERARHSKYGEM